MITPNWDGIDLNYYEEVEPFLRVMKDGKFGYLTYDGQMVLQPEYDMAIMDVLNGSLDVIFVRRADEWGAVKVVNNRAGEVDWDAETAGRDPDRFYGPTLRLPGPNSQ